MLYTIEIEGDNVLPEVMRVNEPDEMRARLKAELRCKAQAASVMKRGKPDPKYRIKRITPGFVLIPGQWRPARVAPPQV